MYRNPRQNMDKNPKTNKKKIKQECRQETFREANTRLYRPKCTIRKNKTTINKRQTDNRTNKRDNLEMSIDPAQGNKPSLLCFRSLARLTQEADIKTVYT